MGLFDNLNPDAMALLSAGGAMATPPTRVPVPFSFSAAQGMGAIPAALANYQNMQGKNIENQMNSMNLGFTQASMPIKMAAMQNWAQQHGMNNPPMGMPNADQQQSPQVTQPNTQPVSGNQALPHPLAIMMAESGGNMNPPAGDGGQAIGPMQLHQAAADEMGVKDRNDPMQNLIGGQQYLQKYTDVFSDKPNPQLWATVAYNQGPGFAKTWDGSISSLSPTGQAYVQKVNGLMGGKLLGAQASPQAQNNNIPKNSNIPILQQQIQQLSSSIDGNKLFGFPTAADEVRLKGLQDQLNAATSQQNEANLAGPKAEAVKNADNLSDAQKTYDVAASNLPRALERFQQLRDASKDASYGAGVDEEGNGLGPKFAQTGLGQLIEPKTATANQIIQQASNQGILSELGPQLQGLKGNKFLESIANNASGLDASDPPATKINAINGLQAQYVANLKSLAAQRRSYGDNSVPSDAEIDAMVAKNTPVKPHPLDGTVAKNAQGKTLILRNGKWIPQ